MTEIKRSRQIHKIFSRQNRANAVNGESMRWKDQEYTSNPYIYSQIIFDRGAKTI